MSAPACRSGSEVVYVMHHISLGTVTETAICGTDGLSARLIPSMHCWIGKVYVAGTWYMGICCPGSLNVLEMTTSTSVTGGTLT